MKHKSFKGQHFIAHIQEDINRLNSEKLKDYPHSLLISSEYVYAPMSREELKGLADFINNYLENN